MLRRFAPRNDGCRNLRYLSLDLDSEAMLKTLVSALVLGASFIGLSGLAQAGSRPPETGLSGSSRSGLDLRNLTDEQLRRRIQDACIFQLSETEETIKTNAVSRCGCYANNLTKAMTKDEADGLRSNGTYVNTARPKVESALKACKV